MVLFLIRLWFATFYYTTYIAKKQAEIMIGFPLNLQFQVDAYEEISKLIAEFVTTLPTTATEHGSENMDQSSDKSADAHSDHPVS